MVNSEALLIATSRADENALLSLADLSLAITDSDAVIIGGHMVTILQTSYPADTKHRRTTDSDAGLSTQVAASGGVGRALEALGYKNTESSNRYTKGKDPNKLVIDLLVPSNTEHFVAESHGEGTFDAVPGLRLAMSGEGIHVDVRAILLDETELTMTVRVPTVEAALVIKALAYAGRRAPKDVEDIRSLLEIVHAHGVDSVGGWKLDARPLQGARLDAARALHDLAQRARSSPAVRESGVSSARLALLISRWIGQPN